MLIPGFCPPRVYTECLLVPFMSVVMALLALLDEGPRHGFALKHAYDGLLGQRQDSGSGRSTQRLPGSSATVWRKGCGSNLAQAPIAGCTR